MLTVQVHLEFDRSIRSTLVQSGARDEATAIWNAYGVELLWSDTGVDAPLHLDVVVGRNQVDPVFERSPSVLARTMMDPSGVVHGPIRIFSDRLEALLRQHHHSEPLIPDNEYARALGRVLAHEIGHVLLGAPAYHDESGLMRRTLPVADLARADRVRFKLATASAGRLRAHAAQLAVARITRWAAAHP